MGSPLPPAFPSFTSPPLEEVALAVQFQPGAIDTLAAAEFYSHLKGEFPKRDEQPSRPSMSEDFSEGPQPPFRFEVIQAPAMPRLWFLSEPSTRLVQVQADLLAYNWRRSPAGIPTDESYPRYTKLRGDLSKHLNALAASIEGDLHPNWCEVTYINHIGPTSGTERPRVDELLRGVEIPTPGAFLPRPNDVGVNLRFVIPGEGGAARGRLNVALASGLQTTDGASIWVMTLTARVLAKEETVAAALKALDVGHTWVVNGFVELTSDEMHEHWERTT